MPSTRNTISGRSRVKTSVLSWIHKECSFIFVNSGTPDMFQQYSPRLTYLPTGPGTLERNSASDWHLVQPREYSRACQNPEKNTTSCNHQNKNKQSCKTLAKKSWKGLSQTDLQPFSWSVWLNFSHDSAGVPDSEKNRINASAVLCFHNSVCSAVQATSRLSRTSCSYIFLSYRAPVPHNAGVFTHPK